MAGIVADRLTHDAGPNAHCRVKVTLDGVEHVIETGNDELAAHDFNLPRFVRDTLYYLVVVRGVPLAQAVGRVCLGEEATNVQNHVILGKDVTLTNMRGAAADTYINVAPGANGERFLVDFRGRTEYQIKVCGLLNGTGTYRLRMVRDSDDAVLYEGANINAAAGEREFETPITALPAAADGLFYVRFQIKSSLGTNDPIVRSCHLMVR